jgi:hypothetical protein
MSINLFPRFTGAALAAVLLAGFAAAQSHTTLPPLGVNPLVLNFPDQPAGTVSSVATLTVVNLSAVPAAINGIVGIGPFKINAEACTFRLQPNQPCQITVQFAPTADGAQGGAVIIPPPQGNLSGETLVIPLSGNGRAPKLTFSNDALLFPPQRLNAASSPQQITVTNGGSAPLAMTLTAFGDYSVDTSRCPNTQGKLSLDKDQHCVLSLVFTPSKRGVQNGAVIISDNTVEHQHMITLLGTGMAPEVALSQRNLNFGTSPVTVAGGVKSIVLTNNGNDDLHVSALSIDPPGDFQLQTKECISLSPLPPQRNCNVAVVFQPQVSGVRKAVLTINSDAGDPVEIPLVGNATDFSISADATAKTAKVKAGANYALTFTAINGFAAPVTVTCAGLDIGTCTPDNPTVTPSAGGSLVNITVAAPEHNRDQFKGVHNFTVTATSDKVVKTVNLTLTAD